MKPYGAGSNSMAHLKRGGAGDGYADTITYCRCCPAIYDKNIPNKQHLKKMKASERRKNKVKDWDE